MPPISTTEDPPLSRPTNSPWPNSTKAAISFTMDNLGEAQDVNKGLWPSSQPLGTHYSVAHQLPRMLDLLDSKHIRMTYFAESWSLDVYPDVVERVRGAGHEIAWHGWQHEVWSGLGEEEERENFRKSFDKAREWGVRYRGFRPPGGRVNEERTWELLREYGAEYISPLGEFGVLKWGGGEEEGEGGGKKLVVLPFEWRAVDAFYYMDKFAGIREEHREQRGVVEPDVFERYLMDRIDQTLKTNGYLSILFHPFLQLSEEKFGVLERVMDRIGKDEDIWYAPCGEVARWVLEHEDQFPRLNRLL